MNEIYPLISCICITHNRITLLKKAVYYFKMQDYPNKELVISFPEKDILTRHTIEKIEQEIDFKISVVIRPDDELLGSARNNAILQCKGDYVCTWDDDDWYHQTRLSFQFDIMKRNGYEASILNQILLYDQTVKKSYLSFLYTWENTLLCKKEYFLENQYLEKAIGEDTRIVEYLDQKNMIYHIWDMPHLYIYMYHRGNVWNQSHFKYLFNKSKLLANDVNESIQKLLA